MKIKNLIMEMENALDKLNCKMSLLMRKLQPRRRLFPTLSTVG